jgi:L-fucose dehydrogenase
MDLQIKGNVILITGGAKGIGEAVARAAAAEGAIPVIIDRDADAGAQLQLNLRTMGMESELILAELSDSEACNHAVRRTLEKLGRIDALVNNAGVNDGVGLERGSPSSFLTSIERNLLHYYSMAHYALPALKETRGSIVNISSKTAITGQGGTSGYVASKAAILGLTREWAAELLTFGIRVNAVIPAEVMTPLYQQWLATFPDPQKKREQIMSKIPLGNRMTTTKEIADMVVFLLSDRAAHITGQYLFVDGGYVHLDRALT